ncbi:MAG: LysR substrate-binding domain-containing protein [Pseudomonadota bacterium]
MPLRRLPPLAALRAFEAAARHLSFKDAAVELAVTPAAVSQQIKALEQDLEILLFHRASRSVTLTQEGAALSAGLSDVFLQLRDVVEQTRHANSPELTVTTSPAIAAKWLTPRIHKFSQAHPELSTQIMSDYAIVQLGDGGPSIAVRCGGKPTGDLYFRPLCDEVVLPLASPDLVARLDLAEPSDIMRAPLIHDMSHAHVVATMPSWTDWFAKVGLDPRNAQHGTRFVGGADLAINAAIAGSGVLLGRIGLAMDDLAAGRLVCPFGPVLPTDSRYYVVCPSGYEERECIRTFMDWVEAQSAETISMQSVFLAKLDAHSGYADGTYQS